jgi:hypothetical protein
MLAFPGAFAGLWLIGGLEGLVAGFVAGEMTSIAAGVVLLNRNAGRHVLSGFGRLGRYIISALLTVAWTIWGRRLGPGGVVAISIGSAAMAAWVLFADWRAVVVLLGQVSQRLITFWAWLSRRPRPVLAESTAASEQLGERLQADTVQELNSKPAQGRRIIG